VLVAAQRLFFARGVEAVSMEAVAAEARVSKMTLYGLFPDKNLLFEAVIGSVGAALFEGLQSTTAMPPLSLAETLTTFGTRLLSLTTHPDVLAFDRLMGAQAARWPDLARRFHEAGPARALAMLAGMIGQAAARGEVDVDDPTAAAQDFVGLLQGMGMSRLHLGIDAPPDAATIEARTRRAVKVFMRAYSSDR
jgi:TetR/AcrR family transcriptional repressor of mexJK operon